MATRTLSVTIPEELYALLESQRKKGHFTRSEFVRHALRQQLSIPTAEATSEEVEAIERGRKEIAAGDSETLDEVLNELS